METELEPEPTEGLVLSWPPLPAAAGVVVILSALLHPSRLLLHRQLVPGTVRPAGPAEDTSQNRAEDRATLLTHSPGTASAGTPGSCPALPGRNPEPSSEPLWRPLDTAGSRGRRRS